MGRTEGIEVLDISRADLISSHGDAELLIKVKDRYRLLLHDVEKGTTEIHGELVEKDAAIAYCESYNGFNSVRWAEFISYGQAAARDERQQNAQEFE